MFPWFVHGLVVPKFKFCYGGTLSSHDSWDLYMRYSLDSWSMRENIISLVFISTSHYMTWALILWLIQCVMVTKVGKFFGYSTMSHTSTCGLTVRLVQWVKLIWKLWCLVGFKHGKLSLCYNSIMSYCLIYVILWLTQVARIQQV